MDLTIFAHIPKTAGTTINDIVEPNYTKIFEFYSRKNQGLGGMKNWVDKFNLEKNKFAGEDQKLLLRGHIGFGVHNFLNITTCRYLTVLRHPVDRVISHYYYFARPESESKLIAQDMTLENFVKEKKHIIVDNFQTRFISGLGWQRNSIGKDLYPKKFRLSYGACQQQMLLMAKENLDNFIFFGLQSRFDETLKFFQDIFGWQNVNFDTQKNVNHKKPKRESLDPSLVELIERENQLDMELYDYAQKTFDKQLENLHLGTKIIDVDSQKQQSIVNLHRTITNMKTAIKREDSLTQESKGKLAEANELFTQAQYQQAIAKYKEVIQANPKYVPALNKLASSYIRMNEDDQAIVVLKKVIELAPNKDKAYTKLAKLLEKKGQKDAAVKAYKKAISIDSEQPDWVFINLGKSLRNLSKGSQDNN